MHIMLKGFKEGLCCLIYVLTGDAQKTITNNSNFGSESVKDLFYPYSVNLYRLLNYLKK